MHPAAPNPTPGPEALATLRGHFLNLDSAQHGAKWDQLWAEDFAPWDRGLPNPALDDALAERRDLFGARVGAHGGARKKALVPGCGRGYDVLLLSAAGYDAYGLELSDTALQGARALERESGGMEEYRVRDAAVGRGRVTYLAGDFFQDDFREGVEGGGKFDLIYDYTVCHLVGYQGGVVCANEVVLLCASSVSQASVVKEILGIAFTDGAAYLP
jgi:SAM-dependent methyltransferase